MISRRASRFIEPMTPLDLLLVQLAHPTRRMVDHPLVALVRFETAELARSGAGDQVAGLDDLEVGRGDPNAAERNLQVGRVVGHLPVGDPRVDTVTLQQARRQFGFRER